MNLFFVEYGCLAEEAFCHPRLGGGAHSLAVGGGLWS